MLCSSDGIKKLNNYVIYRLVWVKKELVNSFRENDVVQEPGLNIANVTGPGEAITHMNSYEEIITTYSKKTIGYVPKQGQM